ncbi:MAG: molybdopterin molybdotransferase MoeA [Alphaproteobacteria bacterium]|nr:molybdopterin molybdotransferase MoeA [Alphaproteobacteria bacterium]
MPSPLLAVDDAIKQIIAAMPSAGEETLNLNTAPMADLLGRVLAHDVTARLTHPPHDVSAMDGYAVRAADVMSLPAAVEVIGESAAGHPFDGSITGGQAVRIFTGAHCPPGTEVIILQEDTTSGNGVITINDAPAAGKFIRPKGNDFAAGDLIAKAGCRLDARHLALIASSGHGEVTVKTKPLVAVISTGDELVPPGTTPSASQIVSSNGVMLAATLTALGAEVLPIGIVADQDDALAQALRDAAKADLIVTSGGASVGQHDGIARIMTADQDALTFWRIAMRPGKPLVFGHIHNTPLLGLPGNPVSTGVCAMVFVAAAIRAMLGEDPAMTTEHARLTTALPANDQRQDFLRARLTVDDNGILHASPFSKQDSGMMGLLTKADALVIRPPHAEAAAVGEAVRVLRIPPLI